MEEAYRAGLACLPGMNILSLPKLIQLAGGSEALWGILESGGKRAAALVGGEKAGEFREACRSSSPSRALKELERQGIKVIVPESPGYPQRLAAIYDPPAMLFSRGRELPADSLYVSVVGSRKASGYGKWAAQTIGGELARLGIIVVSGAAYGVDAHAHIGCLRASGFTVAVLGCGVDRVYPAGHEQLFDRIVGSGCLISEYPPGTQPLPWRFPHRNRIIAGISHAVVVVEASEKSGALITADMALEEGRDVMAVPGPINSCLSLGTNALIQKGAKLVRSIEDICEELPYDFSSKAAAVGPLPGALQRECNNLQLSTLELLRGGPRTLDWLAVSLQRPVGELLSELTEMSLAGWVAEEAGGKYRLLHDPQIAIGENNNRSINIQH